MDNRRDDHRDGRPGDGTADGFDDGRGDRADGRLDGAGGSTGSGQLEPGQVEPEHAADAYIGPATVVASSGLIPVEAELLIENERSGSTALRTWSGRLEAADTGVNVFAVAVSPCTLRLPDGREGTFTPGRVTVGTGVIPVTGCGLAPFDG